MKTVDHLAGVNRESAQLHEDLRRCQNRIAELEQTENLLAEENRILEMITTGEPLPLVLESICRVVERHAIGSVCSILLLKEGRLWHGAAPSLPVTYIGAFNGSAIGPNTGPCGRACFFARPMMVCDIKADPLGDDYRELAVSHGLHACWSTPIFSSEGNVLGSFAVLAHEPRNPSPPHQEIIAQVTHLAAVAIERRHIEEAMRAAKVRFEGILEIADDAIISVDANQRIVLFNQGAEKVFGYAQTEVIGQSLALLLPRRFARAHSGHIEMFGKSPEVSRLMGQRREVFGRRKDGSEFPTEASISKLDLGGEVMFTVILRDVTEQKRLESRLRRSEQNLAEGQRLTKTGIWILDFKTGNTDWSVETCRIFGFPDPPPSPHYNQFRERVRPEDRDGVDRGLRESFETGEPRPLKYIFVLPDGTRKHIETVSQRFMDSEGGLKLMGTVMDVTERVKAQEALQRSEDNLRLAIDTIPGLVWTSLPDGNIDYLNKRWLDYTGLKMEEATAWGWQAAIHPDDLPGLIDYWCSILTAGTPGEYEARLRRHDGVYRWFLFRGVPLFDAQERLVKWYGTNTDVDDRRASELLSRGQVEALKQTLDALAMESSPDRFVEHVLSTMTAQLRAHSCSVWQQEQASGLIGFEFGFEAGKFMSKSDVLNSGIKVLLQKEEFWAWPKVVHTGKPSVVADIREAPSFPWQERLISQGIVTILVVPMLIAGRVDGLISVRFTQKRAFRIEELELAQALAHQAMLAMQLTRLSMQSRESAVLAERNRMARDLHDTLAQGFTGVITQLEAAKGASANADTSSVTNHIERAETLARASLGEARRSVRAMRSRSLVDGTLSTALDELLKRMTSGTELQAELVVQGESRSLPSDWEESLLRITQESLTNTLKYAHARAFRATLSFAADTVQLQLVDDGRGFDPNAEHEGFGLLGMKERAGQLAGNFVLRSSLGQGTEIVVELDQVNRRNANHEDRQI